MSLYGYRPKTKKANWTLAFPEPASAAALAPLHPKKRALPTNGSRARRAYRTGAREFADELRRAGRTCPVVAAVPELRAGFKYGHPVSSKITEVHHVYGRVGRLLNWKPGWLGVSKEGHRWVHANPEQARSLGFLGPVGTYNDYERARKDFENNYCNTNKNSI
jgi:hypothetical protein